MSGSRRVCKKEIESIIKGKIEGKVETVKNMFEMGISFEKVLECANLDKDTYKKYADNIQ